MNPYGRVNSMGRYASERSAQFYAQTYDVSVGDWPGEIEFYQNFASRADAVGQAIDFSKNSMVPALRATRNS